MKHSKGHRLVPCRRDASLAIPYTCEEKKMLTDREIQERIRKIAATPMNRR